jgi:esterase/lipase superfamily enzyme
MMDEVLQQFALLDILIENWDGIRVRMGRLAPALEDQFAQLARQLSAAQEPGQIAILLDKLFDLTEETGAYPYVRELIARAALPSIETTRGIIGVVAAESFAVANLTKATSDFPQEPAGGSFSSVPIFFATNRKVLPELDLEHRYIGEYTKDLSYGRAKVTIPVRHRVGKVERPSRFGRESEERHIIFREAETLDNTKFATQLGEEIERVKRKELLIFLHGYRVTFEEAARRAAQVATDIQFRGVVILFSWPSAGDFRWYSADEDCAAKSAEPLTNFLRDLEGGPWTKVHLVAHSMGNRVMISGLASRVGLTLPLHNIVLVAADVDIDLFEQQFPRVSELVRRERGDLITSYATNSDRALLLSGWFHRSNRLGRFRDEPYATAGLETIDATAVDSSLVGHSYFSDERSVLTDLGLLVRESLPASRRGLTACEGLPASQPGSTNPARKWWAFPT